MAVPKYDELFNPLVQAMYELGGSASVSEIEAAVAQILGLTEKEINEIHRGNRTKLSYRLAWTRNYLKRYGLLENSSRGIWALTQKAAEIKKIDKTEINKFVKNLDNKESKSNRKEKEEIDSELWRDKLMDKLMSLAPSAFEKLCQRILRESGFEEVKVTGHSGDGGIDGKGKIRINGLITFKVVFQCKRYKRNVSSKELREFRGSIQGKADRGLFITTSNFTVEAKKEADREGASVIDLIDGELLMEKMKELELGVEIKKEEVVVVKSEFFRAF